MAAMWRVVCKGPGPLDKARRLVDRGPLHPDKARAEAFAAYFRATGLYESVELMSTDLSSAPAMVLGRPPGESER